MAIFLSAISTVGATVVFGFLIRNLINCPALVAAAKYPSYTRISCHMSHVVCLCCLLPWTAAAFNGAHFLAWVDLMVSPIFLTLIFGVYASRQIMARQNPEIREYAQEQAKNSRVGQMMAERFQQK